MREPISHLQRNNGGSSQQKAEHFTLGVVSTVRKNDSKLQNNTPNFSIENYQSDHNKLISEIFHPVPNLNLNTQSMAILLRTAVQIFKKVKPLLKCLKMETNKFLLMYPLPVHNATTPYARFLRVDRGGFI